MRRDGRLLRAAALLSAAVLTGAGAGAATATTVSTPQALQAAVATANASGGGAITLAPGTYALTAPLVISSPIRLVGPGRPEGDAGAAVITGSGSRRILDVRPVAAAAATPAVSGLVLTQGSAGTGKGGAVVVATGARLVLRESTVSRSRASEGGGVHSAGSVLLDRVTLTGNTATSKGGGLENDGTAWVVNSTVDGNTAGGGGGVASAGTTRLRFSTITRNVSGNKNGGGLYRPGGVLEVEASIVSDNRTSSNAVHDCYGSPAFIGVNLIGNPQGCNPKGGTLVTGDARLGGLADNGGATQTRALGDGSAALDRVTGAPAALSTPLETAVVDSGVDQRRVTRPGGSGSDVGAFERAPLSVSATLTGPAEVRAGASQVMLDALGRLTGGGTSGAGSTLAAAPLTSIAPGGDLSATPLTSIPL
ncbi:MAG: hypothetical protein MUE51_13570, partial [Thermoleophilia bacterium]|nr:hypothetical protein [Thermoleophilia bacterium]